MNYIFSLFLFFGLFFSSNAQNVNVSSVYVLPAIVVDGDTLAVVQLDKVYIFPPLQFDNHDEYLRYRRLVRDVKKVYPYSLIARRTMIEIQLELQNKSKKRDEKKYVKERQEELMEMYAEELKKLTIRQGQILIKLVDRELDQSSYDVIKDLRGGVSAFMWQQVARLFGESLKAEYDPIGEDALIERIVTMIEQGRL
ncbi:MAG: DUF4294 domain-containing protein [Bacteroidales bacterium]|jgi:hypothetical protein|nr:DUF4294 domain-containing protein [Bacteroidales bacterium]